MLFLGLILAAVAVTAGVGIALENAGPASLTVFGETVPGVTNDWQVFFAGAAVAVVFIVGMMITFVGTGRLVRARRDLRYLRAEHEESLTTLEMEKRKLQQELARVRHTGGPAPTPAPAQDRPQAQATAPAGARPAPRRPQVSAASPFFDRAD